MWSHVRSVRSNMSAADPVPVSVHVNITGRCPCRCWHCEKSQDRGGVDLDDVILGRCLELAAAWRSPVLYSGGEPLAHTGWPRILRKGMDLGLVQKMVTSGVGIAQTSDQDRQLLANALDELLVSVDSNDARTHDSARGRAGLFDEVMGWLRGSVRPRRVWLVHVPDAELGSVSGMIDLAASLDVGLIVQPFSFVSNFPHLTALATKSAHAHRMRQNAAQVGQRARELEQRARQRGVPTNLGEVALYLPAYCEAIGQGDWFGKRLSPGLVCSVPWQQLTVDELGNLLPCSLMRGARLRENADIAMQWREMAVAYRDRIFQGETWPECRGCTCHISANLKHGVISHPWSNRSLVRMMATKRLRNIWYWTVRVRQES